MMRAVDHGPAVQPVIDGAPATMQSVAAKKIFRRKQMAYFVEGIRETADPQMQVRRIGEFETVAAAIAAAQQTVDAFLQHTFKPGMDAKTLLAHYHAQAEHPMIFRDDDSTFNVPGFNHIHYAMTRVRELCGA